MKKAIDQRRSSGVRARQGGGGGGPFGKELSGLTGGVKGTARGPHGDR